MGASMALYAGGMVLNDVFDYRRIYESGRFGRFPRAR